MFRVVIDSSEPILRTEPSNMYDIAVAPNLFLGVLFIPDLVKILQLPRCTLNQTWIQMLSFNAKSQLVRLFSHTPKSLASQTSKVFKASNSQRPTGTNSHCSAHSFRCKAVCGRNSDLFELTRCFSRKIGTIFALAPHLRNLSLTDPILKVWK